MAAIVLAAAASSAATAAGASTFVASMAAFAGSYVGSQIDRMLFGSNGRLPDIQGPRLTDLLVQVSTYGKPIPMLLGNCRTAGNVIWSRPIKESSTSTTQTTGGGKGGGGSVKQTTTTYSYSVSLAIAICEGPITEIMNVWADAKLLDPSQGTYHLYYGDEEQLPDPFMAAFHPDGETPAYRGLAYVVIEDFPLADYGNRIPNFTFEVKRVMRLPGSLEDKITDITLIPGAGEYVYDTTIQEKQLGENDSNGSFTPKGKTERINAHNLSSKADVLVALDDLERTLPNIEWVSLVINWFCTTTDAGSVTCKPGVEFGSQGTRIQPDEWSVAGYNRDNAHAVLYFEDGAPTYGGTPTDKSIIRLCQELKNRGYKILLYPMLQVDQITPVAKPWRGRITPNNAGDVTDFFRSSNGYNAFVLHYTNLQDGPTTLKSLIDGIIIASEFVSLTQYMPSPGVFPAVAELKNLATLTKAAVGSSVRVIYAADWSEYHSINGWFHMDPLWADPNIDVVGIDAYFPLTPDIDQRDISYQSIYDGWTEGEGYEYFYGDSSRTGRTDYVGGTYAWKNVRYWWSNTHRNPDNQLTAWTPRMKSIWFTELGFPSVDGCSNQPNVFYDPDSVESFFPRGSRGRVDFSAQRLALTASIDFLNDQRSAEPGLVNRKFIWTWDARPYPFWPNLEHIWADFGNWKTGHWIQGKLGLSNLGVIVAYLLNKLGFTPSDYDVSELSDIVEGYIINNRQTVRSCLEQLAAAYFFDCIESSGILRFIKRGGASRASIDVTELVTSTDPYPFTITRTPELELPRQIDVIYIDSTTDYQASTQSAQRQTVYTQDYTTINLPLVLNAQAAKTIADITLYNAWISRVQYAFSLPPHYALLEPGDIITITDQGITHLLRMLSSKIVRQGIAEITAIADDSASYDFYRPAASPVGNSTLPPPQPSAPLVEILDLPLLPGETEPSLHYALSSTSAWNGAVLYRSDDNGANYSVVRATMQEAITGATLSALSAGPAETWDETGNIEILLRHGELQSVSELGVLNGMNSCVIGQEIVQFQFAELIAPYKYRLYRLLRGRLGTEWAIADHLARERFVLLNNSLIQESVTSAAIGITKPYKAVAVGQTLATTPAFDVTFAGNCFKPFAPVHVQVARDSTANITLSWIRRTRVNGEWRDYVDVLLGESSEAYDIEIMDGSTVKRTLTSTVPMVLYPTAQQIADFGTAVTQLHARIYQLSTTIGRGYPASYKED